MKDRPTINNNSEITVAQRTPKRPNPALLQLVRLMARIDAEATFAEMNELTKLDRFGESTKND